MFRNKCFPFLFFLFLFFIGAVCAHAQIEGETSGALVIVGGGGTPKEVLKEFVELAGGPNARVCILPQASQRKERGKSSLAAFKSLGVKRVAIVETTDSKVAQKKLQLATAVWFPGGSQSRLFNSLRKAGLVKFLQSRHKAGVVFGGTSAGAAIMSKIMIPSGPKKQALSIGNTPTNAGLGLACKWLIDQHFIERSRMNRLLSAVMDHRDLVGIGIGESTAIILKGSSFKVMGKGSVVVMDARKANVTTGESLQSGSGIVVHLLRDGHTFSLRKGVRTKRTRKSGPSAAFEKNIWQRSNQSSSSLYSLRRPVFPKHREIAFGQYVTMKQPVKRCTIPSVSSCYT